MSLDTRYEVNENFLLSTIYVPNCDGCGKEVDVVLLKGTQTMELDINSNILIRAKYKCPKCGKTYFYRAPYVEADDDLSPTEEEW